MTPEARAFVVYEAVVGSHGYGLATPTSDLDTRAVFVPPAAWHWSLTNPPPEQVETTRDGADVVTFEVGKFLRLALKGSPTILEVLYAERFQIHAPAGEQLRALRGAFLSQKCLKSYRDYATAQAALVRRQLAAGKPWQKSALHRVRLLFAGLHLARTGEVLVNLGEHIPELRAIRAGETTWEAIEARAEELAAELETATHSLPETPDFAAVEAYLQATRRAAVEPS